MIEFPLELDPNFIDTFQLVYSNVYLKKLTKDLDATSDETISKP